MSYELIPPPSPPLLVFSPTSAHIRLFFSSQISRCPTCFISIGQTKPSDRSCEKSSYFIIKMQLEKVLLNAAYIRGSIEGIAGQDNINLALTDEEEDKLLD